MNKSRIFIYIIIGIIILAVILAAIHLSGLMQSVHVAE